MPNFSIYYRKFSRLLNSLGFKTNLRSVSTPTINKERPKNTTFEPANHLPKFPDATKCRLYSSPGSHVYSINKRPPTRQTKVDRTGIRLTNYLSVQQNPAENISKIHNILAMQRVILEIGCGACEVARKIALKNPDWGVIATDKYDWDVPSSEGSQYQKVAQAWKNDQLEVHQNAPANLIILRAEAEILQFIPDYSIDTILLVNPEPIVGQAFIELLSEQSFFAKIKPGDRQIVIVPFSRDMGWGTCGGYEFCHSEDRSMGLGFITAGGLKFKRTSSVQWGVDLRKSSPYSKNSTQTNVFLYGIGL